MSDTIDQLALEHADRIHRDQGYGDKPYMVHLMDVERCLIEFGFADDKELLAAAWLHDAMEDQNISREWIEAHFGYSVACLVWRVTNGPGENRVWRFENTWPKIAYDQRALALKLADRIANVRASKTQGRLDLLSMYRKEYPRFREALYAQTNSRTETMWRELDSLLTETV